MVLLLSLIHICHGYDEEERMLLMQMLGVDEDERYEYGDEHFNKQEAKQTVDEMYHVKDGKKYIGEKYDMQKAHEVCNLSLIHI